MAGKKSVLLCATLCTLFASSVFISAVNARAVSEHHQSHHHPRSHSSSHHSNGSSSRHHSDGSPSTHHNDHHDVSSSPKHHKDGGSIDHEKRSPSHTYPPSVHGEPKLSAVHSKPSFFKHSLSGDSGSSSYPASNKLPGSARSIRSSSGSLNPFSDTQSSFGNQFGSMQMPSVNFGSNFNTYSTTSKPNYFSGISSGFPSSNIQSSFGTQFGSASVNNYPASPPNSMSGSSSSINFGSPASNTHSSFATQKPATISGATNGLIIHPNSRLNFSTGDITITGNPSNTQSSFGFSVQPASYPASNGLSGNKASFGSNSRYDNNDRSSVYHYYNHYVYNPPSIMRYRLTGSMDTISYPIYMGAPPPYVYEYRYSNNKYRHLLSGLALYNLGQISVTPQMHNFNSQYRPKPDEYCKFGVKYWIGTVEEMAINCEAITYFIYEDEFQRGAFGNQRMFPNGSLMDAGRSQTANDFFNTPLINKNPKIFSANDAKIIKDMFNTNGLNFDNTHPTNGIPQVMPVSDPRLAGRAVEVKLNMECYVTRDTGSINMKKTVPCELLQEYSAALRKSSSAVKASLTVILAALAVAFYH